MASFISNKARCLLATKALDLVNDTLKIVLVTSAHTPSKADNFMSTYTASELSGTGYTAGFGGSGRKTLTSKAVTQDDTNNWAVFDADDPTWTAINAGSTPRALIIKEVTSDSDSPIIAVIDLPSTITTNGGDFTIHFAAAASGGVFYIP